jgi:large subunit ribosomal protein L29
MSLAKFTEIVSLSNNELSQAIVEAETELFNLRFRQATRQSFKAHQIKNTKRRIAQLKTLLTLRLQNLDQDDKNLISN